MTSLFDLQAPSLAKQGMFLPGLLFSFPLLPHWAKPRSPQTQEKGLVTWHTATSLAEQTAERDQKLPALFGSDIPALMVPMVLMVPHTAWLQHFQVLPSLWWPQDCSLKREGLTNCFHQDWRMRGSCCLNHSIFSGLQYHWVSLFLYLVEEALPFYPNIIFLQLHIYLLKVIRHFS